MEVIENHIVSVSVAKKRHLL